MTKVLRNLRQILLFARDRNFMVCNEQGNSLKEKDGEITRINKPVLERFVLAQIAKNRIKVHGLAVTIAIIGLIAIGTASAQNSDPGNLRPPAVPDNLKVEEGNKVFLVGRAVGTQNYVCKASGAGFKFVLFTPQATLFGADSNRELIHHFFSPNPFETNTDPTVVTPALGDPGLIRATWQHSRDASTVWAFATPDTTSTDARFVEKDAVAWLTLTASGTQDGPTGGHTLSETTFVQRLNTHGGVAPKTGCASGADVGNEAFVPYTADYFFYKKDESAVGRSH